jgi:hypothetical protein
LTFLIESLTNFFLTEIFFSISSEVCPGLPDGLFLDQKSQFGYILEGLGMENVGIFFSRLV